jgi:hypothetical protein
MDYETARCLVASAVFSYGLWATADYEDGRGWRIAITASIFDRDVYSFDDGAQAFKWLEQFTQVSIV